MSTRPWQTTNPGTWRRERERGKQIALFEGVQQLPVDFRVFAAIRARKERGEPEPPDRIPHKRVGPA
jgi:hypothetical protein